MGDPKGFLKVARAKAKDRPAHERLAHWGEFTEPPPREHLEAQASRCMECGIPFCHQGCPLGNLIPEWNDLVHRGRWDEARARLEETNNFPEVTGRVCPAPCEASCVLNIGESPVTIKDIERSIADHVFGAPLVPRIAPRKTGKRVGVVGSGPAGLAAAQQLARAGHDVTVLERDDRIGGLLRYGIPDFKMEKGILDARVAQMRAEGVTFETGVDVGGALSSRSARARRATCLCPVASWRACTTRCRSSSSRTGAWPATSYPTAWQSSRPASASSSSAAATPGPTASARLSASARPASCSSS